MKVTSFAIALVCLVLVSGCGREDQTSVSEPVPLGSLHDVEALDIPGIGVVTVGAILEHPKFGRGEVLVIEAGGPVTSIQIRFGSKERWIVAEGSEMKVVEKP